MNQLRRELKEKILTRKRRKRKRNKKNK